MPRRKLCQEIGMLRPCPWKDLRFGNFRSTEVRSLGNAVCASHVEWLFGMTGAAGPKQGQLKKAEPSVETCAERLKTGAPGAGAYDPIMWLRGVVPWLVASILER